jgi:hypothetical protein
MRDVGNTVMNDVGNTVMHDGGKTVMNDGGKTIMNDVDVVGSGNNKHNNKKLNRFFMKFP